MKHQAKTGSIPPNSFSKRKKWKRSNYSSGGSGKLNICRLDHAQRIDRDHLHLRYDIAAAVDDAMQMIAMLSNVGVFVESVLICVVL